MEALPFATKPVGYSVWGGGPLSNGLGFQNGPIYRTTSPTQNKVPPTVIEKECRKPVETAYANNNLEYMPAVLLNTLKREKKPFTYTPGRIDLSEVLNDKLQKRIEKRKKRAQERSFPQSPIQDPPTFEPKQVLVMPTYNSPLNMYSMENALEALEVQAELTVRDDSFQPLPSTNFMTLPRNYKYQEPKDYEAKNVAQSKAFKVLQIITDTEEEKGENNCSENVQGHQDEMRFTGIRPSDAIPSKYFHNLQKMTEQESSNTNQGTSFERYQDEMRFSGTRSNKVIPSKLFHNLQKMTGTDEEETQNNEGTMTATNSGVWKVTFSPKDNMLHQVKSSLQMNHQPMVRKEDTNIPNLQRPAAFLPAKQTMPVKQVPRFNAMNMSRSHQHGPTLFGGPNF